MKKNIYKHSFARRLTRWLMLVLFVMMAGLAYLIYEVVKMSMVEIVALNFHDIMELSEKNICDALSDVSVVVENNIFYIDRDIGQPAELQATMERMVAQNPRMRGYAAAASASSRTTSRKKDATSAHMPGKKTTCKWWASRYKAPMLLITTSRCRCCQGAFSLFRRSNGRCVQK